MFCVDTATRDELADVAARLGSDVERVAAGAGVLYWEAPRGSSVHTPFAKASAKVRYKARTTTRNVRTLKRFS
jgi:Ni,Fe-hydrogenase III large subunit